MSGNRRKGLHRAIIGVLKAGDGGYLRLTRKSAGRTGDVEVSWQRLSIFVDWNEMEIPHEKQDKRTPKLLQ